MKGKTGKMKGGGLARRGVGAALASGGAVRNAAPTRPGIGIGSKPSLGEARMGSAPRGTPAGGRTAAGGRSSAPPAKSGSSRFKDGGKIKKMAMGGPTMERKPMPNKPGMNPIRGKPGMTRPGFPSRPGTPKIGGPLPPAGPDYRVGMPGPGYSFRGMKKGGKVKGK